MKQKRLKTAGITYMAMPGLLKGTVIVERGLHRETNIINTTFRYFGIPIHLIRNIQESGKTKHSSIRMICYLLLRRYTRLTLQEIGQIFHTDHSTVSKGLKYVLKNEKLLVDAANIELLILNKQK